MKRFFAFAGLMTAAAISLTNCQPKEIAVDAAASGSVFSLTASAPATKTTNSDLSTLWAQDDELAVFYSEGNGYTSLGAVPIVDGVGTSSGKFELSSQTALPSQADWYILYPYYELHDSSSGDIYNQLNTPAAHTGDGWMYFGNRKGLTQSGMDSKAHLAGQHMPMYAVQKAGGPSMSVTMKHLTSVVEFNLKNSTGSEISVASVTLDASEPVVGCFCVDLTAEPAAFEAHTATSVASKAVINVENGTLPSGGMGLVYLPIKPYTQDLSTPLKVTVAYTGDAAGTFVKEFTLTQAQAVFEPGKIKKITVEIPAGGSTSSDTVADAQSAEGTYSISEAQVTAIVGTNMFITDNTGTILVYSSNASNYKVGDYVSVSGDTKAWNNLMEFNNPTIVKVKDGSFNPNPSVWTDTQMAGAYGTAQVAYVTYQAEFSGNRNGIIPGSDAILYTTNASGVSQTKGKTYKVTGYVYGWTDYVKNEVTTKEVCMYVVFQEEVGATQTASLEINPKSMTFEKEGGEKTVTVTCDNTNWTYSGAPTWVTLSRNGDKVTVTAEAYTGEEKREGTVTFTHSNGTLSAELKLTQKGAAASDNISLSPASFTFDAVPAGPLEVTVTSNADGWTYDDPTETWIHLSTNGNTVTVTVDENTGDARNVTVKFHHANGTPNANLVINQRAKSSGNKVTYTKVTSGTIGTGDYLIVCEDAGKALDGSLTDYSKANSMDVTINGNTITVDEGSDIHYDATSKTIVSASGLYIGAKSNNNNGISTRKSDPAGSSPIYVIDITVSNGEASIGCTLDAGFHSLKYNNTNGSDFFRFYKPTSTLESKPLSIYKKN